jgi:type IV pilus assembly protein PilC
MIKAGEFSGALDSVLERLSQYLESADKLNRKVRAALIYPSVIVCVAFLVTAIIFLKVIPGFKTIFSSLGAKLPLPTQIVFNLSSTLQRYFPFIVIGTVVVIVVMRKISAYPKARLAIDKMKLNFPLLGKFFRKVVVARFSRTLSTLLKSGVSILAALEIGSKTSGNKIVEHALDKVTVRVSKGEKIGEALAESKIFAPLVVSLVSVGEETGDISSMLDKIADFYEEEVDIAATSLTSLIEPFIIVFLGVVIGGIVISMFLPILQITQMLGGAK